MSVSCECGEKMSPCCSEPDKACQKSEWEIGSVETPAGSVPRISTTLSGQDRVNAWKLRWGIGRMKATILPGLYAAGSPNPDSPVLVTANYLLTFNTLRADLHGLDVWILVLDTKGINVWCAAGKGTFGTVELIQRIQSVRLDQVVKHKKVILPQLGAPGVAAHEVKKESGFKVSYGPVRSADIPEFIETGSVTPLMRQVRFTLKDRLVLIPMELIPSLKLVPFFLGWLVVIQVLRDGRLSLALFREFLPYLLVILTGSVLFQILLPWIPFRSFIVGGWVLGGFTILGMSLLLHFSLPWTIAHLLLLPPVIAYLAENFTGTTPFTSLSGVQKELRWGLPVMIVSVVAGMILQIVNIFAKGNV